MIMMRPLDNLNVRTRGETLRRVLLLVSVDRTGLLEIESKHSLFGSEIAWESAPEDRACYRGRTANEDEGAAGTTSDAEPNDS